MSQSPSLLRKYPSVAGQTAFQWTALILVFMAALFIRIYRLDQAHLEGSITRQYHSYILARAFYFNSIDAVPDWRRDVAQVNQQHEGVLEPPIMEIITVLAYRLLGDEYIWIPTLISILWWMVGGIGIFFLGRKMFSIEAAIVATAFYLLASAAITASRSFQPEALMMMLIIFSIYASVHYHEKPSLGRLLAAGVLSSLALFVRPMSVFFVLSAFAALTISQWRTGRKPIWIHLFLFLVVLLLPTGVYYIYTIFFVDSEGWISGGRVIPSLWFTLRYWLNWLKLIGVEIGYVPFVLGIVGLIFVKDVRARFLLVSLWVGYIVYGLVFNYHISTHFYYHWPLIPIVALSLGAFAEPLIARLNELPNVGYGRVAALGVLLLAIFLSLYDFRAKTGTADDSAIRIAQEIGRAVDHSPKTVYLVEHYGSLLQYYGEVAGYAWPAQTDFQSARFRGDPELTIEERLTKMDNPDYFIVTQFKEFAQQPDLQAYLADFPLVVTTDSYLIYDLRDGIASAG